MKIDPALASADPRKSPDPSSDDQTGFNTDYGKMRIVQEKKQMYLSESTQFLQRLSEFMLREFDAAARDVRRELDNALSKKVDPRRHDVVREQLWRYSPLVLYTRDVNLNIWNGFIQTYQERNSPLYKSEFRDIVDAWKRNARKPTGEEAELLFTSQVEKQQESTITTARKLTVKRSQTLARSLRSPIGDSSKSLDRSGESRSLPYEVFGGIADDLFPLVEMEQNFVVDFFHATTLETSDFSDVVAATRPKDRRGGDLRRHRLMEPDRELARRVTRAMEAIFDSLDQDLQNTIDWVLSQDPL